MAHFSKVKFNGRPKDNWNTFSSLVPGGKEKRSIVNIMIFYKCLEYKMHLNLIYIWTISYPEGLTFSDRQNLWERYWYTNFDKEKFFRWHYQNKVLTEKKCFRREDSYSTKIVHQPNLRNNNFSSILFHRI